MFSSVTLFCQSGHWRLSFAIDTFLNMNVLNNDKMVHFLCQFLFSERFTGHIELHFIYELL